MSVPKSSILDPPNRILLGPGPGTPHPRVRRALGAPTLGHLDPELLRIFGEEQDLLRYVFQTQNPWTFALSGTGTAGMEASLANLIEPGDAVLVCVNGYFGGRLAEMAARLGAVVDRVERPPGEIFEVEMVATALSKRKYKLVAVVHAETSTGVEQLHIPDLAAAAHAHGTLLILDTVTSLGGIPVLIDQWGIDAAYSASQKNLGAAAGLAPITIGPEARRAIERRLTPVSSFYLDLKLYWSYWNDGHEYHHTAPASLHYGLHQGLQLIAEEGLDHVFGRYRRNAESLWVGLEKLQILPFIPRQFRLPCLTTACVPLGVDPHVVRARLLQEYGIEIAGGFGPLRDKVWRIGLMGYSNRKHNISLLLSALEALVEKTH